jgi:long-chain-fatty-acid---luciferin-component ligase
MADPLLTAGPIAAEAAQTGPRTSPWRRIDGQTLLDHVLYNDEEVFSWPAERRRQVAFQLVASSFVQHYAGCEAYRRLCAAEQVTPGRLRGWADLEHVPLVPSSFFKHHLLQSVPASEVIKVCLSSGTQGSQSRVPRDHLSLERLIGTTRTQVDLLLKPWHRAQIYNLGPDSEEARDMWFAYVMSILELVRPTTHYVRGGVFSPATVAAELQAHPPDCQPVLVGPPILFLHLLDYLEQHRLLWGPCNGLVVTAGGWKRFDDRAISREALTERLVERLGLKGPACVRDAFNMVELNTVLLECEHRRKHVPPWLVVLVRDAGTLAVVPEGSTGLLSYLDTTASSYPGFVLGDDFGSVSEEPCPCGRTGPTLEIGRRVKRIEARGCALKIDRSVAVEAGSTPAAPGH